MALTKPSSEQRLLIVSLVQTADDCRLPADWEMRLLIEEMDDGGMGSLRLEFPGGEVNRHRFDRCASELKFDDADGVEVIASLYLDQHGVPFEVDMWKTNFDKLIQIPATADNFRIGLGS